MFDDISMSPLARAHESRPRQTIKSDKGSAMSQADLQTLAVQLAAFTDLLEQRGTHAVRETLQAAQAIRHSAQEAAASSQRMSASALDEFRRTAKTTLADGLRETVNDAGMALQATLRNVRAATEALEQEMHAVRKVHLATAWKAFIATVCASAAVIGVAVYLSSKAHRDIARGEWTQAINQAIATGRLAACPEGGICAYTDKKWVRLDKPQ